MKMRIARWLIISAATLSFAAYVTSLWITAYYHTSEIAPSTSIAMHQGIMQLHYSHIKEDETLTPEQRASAAAFRSRIPRLQPPFGYESHALFDGNRYMSTAYRFGLFGPQWKVRNETHRLTSYSLDIPLWMPSVTFLALAILLLVLDRRSRPVPGKCSCGYDLSGNVSGVCPECGSTTLQPNQQSSAPPIAPSSSTHLAQ